MQCKSCGTPVQKGVDECPACGNSIYDRDRKNTAAAHQSGDLRRQHDLLFTANYEAAKFGLMPKTEHESIAAYATRIDREKTPIIIKQHQRILVHPQ